MKNRQTILGYLFAIGATAIWSGNFIVARGLSESIPPVSLAFWRWMVAIIVFLPFTYKLLLSERKILKQHIRYLSIVSLLGITTFNTLIYIAGHSTTAINLSLISITFPIFILILTRIFYKEVISIYKGLGISLVVIGVVMLISKGRFSSLLNLSFSIGDIWMLIASFIFAIYSVLLRQKPPNISIWTLQSATFILGVLFLFPFYIWEYTSVPSVEFDSNIILSILYVGIFASLSAFVLWNKAIEVIGPSKAGMVYYTLPLFSGFLAYAFLKETIGIVHFYSAMLIVAGILMANYQSKKNALN